MVRLFVNKTRGVNKTRASSRVHADCVSRRVAAQTNKKQCSGQLQCEVPCSVSNVINFSLFINSSLFSLSSTSHAVCGGGGSGGRGVGEEDGVKGGEGQGTFPSSCHILHYRMGLRPEGNSHNLRRQRHLPARSVWDEAPDAPRVKQASDGRPTSARVIPESRRCAGCPGNRILDLEL